MADFIYRAVDSSGKSLKGHIEAASEAEAVIKLEAGGCSPLSIREKIGGGETPWRRLWRRRKSDRQSLAFFSRQFGTLLQAGIPVVEALDGLRRNSELKGLSDGLLEMMKDIQGGSTIAEAMRRHEDIFPNMYVHIVHASEAGGVVPETLEQVAEMLEEQQETAQAIKSATRYPLIVVGTLLVAFFVLVGFVLPKLSKLFTRFATSLPLPTRIMLQFHVLLKGYWVFMIIGVIGIVVGIYYSLKLAGVRYRWDKLKMRLPIFGPIFSKIYMERFCRMTKVLLHAGVPMLKVLENVEFAMGNVFVGEAVGRLKASVHAGEPMSVFMRQSTAFPHLVAQMTGLGEKSGRLPELLDVCARHYRREIKYKVKNLLTSIEPVLTVVIGAVIFFFMLSVFMPIWDTVKFLK